MKLKLLFVCTGNICRSPSAEAIMRALVEKKGLTDKIECDSAGTHGYHIGELPDARSREHAEKRGYRLDMPARKFEGLADFEDFDYILTMDEQNYALIEEQKTRPEDLSKIHRMVKFCRRHQVTEVPDPYYGGSQGFERVLDILEDACEGFEEFLAEKHPELRA